MLPPPRSRMEGKTALAQFHRPLTLTAMQASQSDSAIVSIRPPVREP